MESRDAYLSIELVIANVAIRKAEFWLEQGMLKTDDFRQKLFLACITQARTLLPGWLHWRLLARSKGLRAGL